MYILYVVQSMLAHDSGRCDVFMQADLFSSLLASGTLKEAILEDNVARISVPWDPIARVDGG